MTSRPDPDRNLANPLSAPTSGPHGRRRTGPPAALRSALWLSIVVTTFACVTGSAVAQTPPAQASSSDGDWTPEFPPGARYGHTAVFAPAEGLMLVFGGFKGIHLNDVWALNLTGVPTWTKLAPSGTPPSGRAGHSAIWDPVRNRMIVFGGETLPGSYANDVWALTLFPGGATWTQLTTSVTRPGARAHHAAVYDPLSDRMLVCMGFNFDTLHDFWALSLASNVWSIIPTQPSAITWRHEHTAVFDAPRNRLVMFGGRDDLNILNDAWALTLNTGALVPLSAAGPPPSPRYGLASFYDAVGDRMVVFGGRNQSSHFNEAWALSFSASPAWTLIPAGGTAPAGRSAHTAVLDPVGDRMVVFGGRETSSNFNDVWELSMEGDSEWSPLLDGGVPAPRSGHSAVLDPLRHRMLVFGGANGDSHFADVGAFSLQGEGVWTSLATTGTPPSARTSHTAIYDPPRDRMLVFGGFNGGASFDDTWALSLSGDPEWTPITTIGAKPGPRTGSAAIYDPIRDRMLILGGRAGITYLGEVWALSLGETPAWTLLTPSGSPPSARAFHSVIYDPARDQLVLFGGRGASGPLLDTWTLALASGPAWAQIPSSGPPARYSHAAIHDANGDRMVVYGGWTGGTMFEDAWALPLAPGSEWGFLAPAGTRPSPRSAPTAIYDVTVDRMVLFGGRGLAGNDNETWSLVWNPRAGVEPPAQAGGVWLAQARPTPSRTNVEILYMLPRPSQVTLNIYDLSGRAVRTLVDGALPAGTGTVRWDRRTSAGALVLPGVYFCELRVEGQRLAKRMVLMP